VISLLLTLALADDGTLVGYTFAADDGAPVPGAVVTVADRQLLSDADGRFEVDLPEGRWEVTLRPPEATGLQGGRLLDVGIVAHEVTEVLVTFTADADPVAQVAEPPARGAVQVDPDAVDGTVAGRVLDEEGAPVAGARLFVRGADVQATTGDDGRYELVLPQGDRQLTVLRSGYATTTSDVVVPGNDRLEHDIVLAPASASLADVVITAPYVEGSVASLMDERRASSAVADVLGAEQMARSGDGDAAAALSRVTGITVVGGKYVYVRGLGDRYSSALLNGSFLPSPEPERRVVPLDLFPSSILESVVVQKSYSPDMPGEFGGGVVQLRTRRPPTEPVAAIGLSGAYRHRTTLQQGLDYQGGPTDWLGFDGGYRDLPDIVVDASADKAIEESDRFFPERGYTAEELERFGEAMPNRWAIQQRQLPPDVGASLTLGHGHQAGDLSFGALAALTYGNDWKRLQFDRSYYIVGANDQLEVQNQYAFDEAANEVALGGFLTGGVELRDQSVRYTGMINRSTDDTTRVYEGFNRDLGDDLRISRTRFVERQLSWHQLLGQHGVFDAAEVGWRVVTARATRDEPDRRETRYDFEPNLDTWLLSDRPEGNGIFDSTLSDETLELAADLKVFLPTLWGRHELDRGFVKAGAVRYTRDRVVDTRRYKYFHKGERSRDEEVLQQDPENVFVPENIGPDGFQFEEFTRQTDNYTASQQLQAFYAMAEVPLTPWTRLMAGARMEASDQQVSTFELFNPDAVPVPASLVTDDLLPAASLTVTPVDDLQVRLGYGKTVSRPDFRELSPATFNDVTGGRLTFGNENLTRATIDHLDLRFDYFMGPGEVLSLSLFRKRFTDPIETIVVVSAQQSVTWANATAATNDGVEVEYRKDLPLNLYSAGNVALVASRIDLGDAGGIQTNDERPLQGQSPYVVNVQLGWDHPDRDDRATLLYNVAGRRIVEVGAQGAPDTYELPVHRLDLVLRKDLGRGLGLTLKGSNLLDSAARTVQGDEEVDAIREGWRVGLGVSWSAF
jgi:hypothetical protein